MRRVLLLLMLSCAPSLEQWSNQCLDHLGEDESSLHGFMPEKQIGGLLYKYVGLVGYRYCTVDPMDSGIDCTGVMVGQLGNSWVDDKPTSDAQVAYCSVAVKDGKVVGAWVVDP